MNIGLSCCGFARSLDEANAIVNVFDARIAQNNIGKVYDRIACIYNIWGYLTNRMHGREPSNWHRLKMDRTY